MYLNGIDSSIIYYELFERHGTRVRMDTARNKASCYLMLHLLRAISIPNTIAWEWKRLRKTVAWFSTGVFLTQALTTSLTREYGAPRRDHGCPSYGVAAPLRGFPT